MGNQNSNDAAGLRSHDTSTVQEEIDALRALLAKNQGGAAESASQSQAQTPPQAQLQPQAQSQSNYSKPHNKFPAPPVAASIPSAYSKESLTKDSAGVESVTPPATGLDNHDLSKVKNHGGTAESASQSQAQTPPQTPPQAQLQPQAQSQSNYSKPHNKFPAPPAAASIPSAYSKESSNNNPPANREEENTSNWSKVVEWAGWGVRKGCKGVCWLIEKCISVGVPVGCKVLTACGSGLHNALDLGIKACGVGATAFGVLPEKTKGTIIGFLGGVGAWYKIKNKLKKLETINLNDAKELIKNGKSEDNEKLAKYLKYTQQITLNKEPEVDTPIETKRSTLGLIVSTTKSTFSAIKNTFSFINNTFFAKKTLQEKGKNEESEIVKEDLHMILLQGAINCHNIEAVKLLLKCNDTIMKKTKAVVSTGKSKGVNLFVSKEIKTPFEGVDVKDKQDLLIQAITKLEELRIPENSYDLSSYINTTATIKLLEIGEVEITVTKQQDQSKKKENIQAKCVVNKGKNDEYRIILYFPIEDSGESQVDNGSSESVDILNSEKFKKLLATQLKNYRDSLDIIDVLLQKGVNPDQLPIKGVTYNIPLKEAMQINNKELFVVLLKNGAKANNQIAHLAYFQVDEDIEAQQSTKQNKTQEIIEQENIDKRPFYKLLAQPLCNASKGQLWDAVTILPHNEEGNSQNDWDTSVKPQQNTLADLVTIYQQIETLNIVQENPDATQNVTGVLLYQEKETKKEIYEDKKATDKQINDNTSAFQKEQQKLQLPLAQTPKPREQVIQQSADRNNSSDSLKVQNRSNKSQDDMYLPRLKSSQIKGKSNESQDDMYLPRPDSSKIEGKFFNDYVTNNEDLFTTPSYVVSESFGKVQYPKMLKEDENLTASASYQESQVPKELPSASNTQVAVLEPPVQPHVNNILIPSSVSQKIVSMRGLDNQEILKQIVVNYSFFSLQEQEAWKQQYVKNMINNFCQNNNFPAQLISDETVKNIVNFISDQTKLVDLMQQLLKLQTSGGEINTLPSPLLSVMFGEEKLHTIAKPKNDITKYDYLPLLNALQVWIAVMDPLKHKAAMSTIVHTEKPDGTPVITFINPAVDFAPEYNRLEYEEALSTKWNDGTANIKDIYDFGCLIYRKGLNREQLKALLGGSTIPQICWNAPKTVLKHMCDGTALGMNVVINKENYVIFAQGGKRLFGSGAKLLLNHVQHKYMLGYTPSQVQQLLLRYNPVKMLENGEKSKKGIFSSRVVDGVKAVAMGWLPNKPPVDNPEDKTQGEDGDEKASNEKTSPEKGQDSAIPPQVPTPVRLNVPFIPGWGVGVPFGVGSFGVKGSVDNMGANSVGVNWGQQDDASPSKHEERSKTEEVLQVENVTNESDMPNSPDDINPWNLLVKGVGWFLGNCNDTSQKASLNKESNKKGKKTEEESDSDSSSDASQEDNDVIEENESSSTHDSSEIEENESSSTHDSSEIEEGDSSHDQTSQTGVVGDDASSFYNPFCD